MRSRLPTHRGRCRFDLPRATRSRAHRGSAPIVAALATLLLLALGTPAARAQSPLYVGDEVFIVLHSCPGTQYRWLARLTPGTELIAGGGEDASDDETCGEQPGDDWQQVTTTRGTTGWVRSEFLSSAKPAQARLPELEQRIRTLTARSESLQGELAEVRASSAELGQAADSASTELARTQEELAQLKAISGRSVQLDRENRELVQEVETLRTEVDMLQADNQRLQENLRSSAFIDGALAVLLGVLITLVVPRLWPKRRRSSSWA